MAIITFLAIGWMLNLFQFERFVVTAFLELFNKNVTRATYYFLFFCIGIFGEVVLLIQGAYYDYFLNK